MKKGVCLMLVGMLLLSFTACGDISTERSTTQQSTTTTTTATAATTTASNEQKEPDNPTHQSAPSLEDAYAYAVEQYNKTPNTHRDIGQLQIETQEIIEIDGKYYQSYVADNVDIRYVFISQDEFSMSSATWDWYTVGTADRYSLDLL